MSLDLLLMVFYGTWVASLRQTAAFKSILLKNAAIYRLANARGDVKIERSKTRFEINKEHPSDLDSGNLTKTYSQNSLLLN